MLKNAIDRVSRPASNSALTRKPIALLGAAPNQFGTVRAQLALRQSLLWTDSRVVTKPEVMAFRANERFDADGILVDRAMRDCEGRTPKGAALVSTRATGAGGRPRRARRRSRCRAPR